MKHTVLIGFLFFFPSVIYADMQSTNYKIESEAESEGSAYSITSTNHKVEESALNFFNTDGLTSTNYKIDGVTGFGGSLVPIISSIAPGNFSKYLTDESPSFTVTAQDPDSDSMEYQLKMDGTVKVAFQSSNVLSHALSGSDRGRHTYTFEVRDADDGTVNQNQYAYMFRRPVK